MHFAYNESIKLNEGNTMTNLVDMTRDQLCVALSDLYSYQPDDFDGLTKAEMWQDLTNKQMEEVESYLAA